MPAAAIAGVVISAYGAYSQNKAANKAAKQQQQGLDNQAKAAQDQLDFGKQQYGDWKSMFYPVAGELKDLAERNVNPDYNAVTADVGNAFDTSRDINMRNMQRMGVKPTDGAMSAMDTQYGLGRAEALAGGMNQARQQAQQQHFSNLASVYGLGSGMMNAGASTMNQGFGNLQGAYGNQAATAGRNMNSFSAAAASGAQGLGYGLNQLSNSGWSFGGGGSGMSAPGVNVGSQGFDMPAFNPNDYGANTSPVMH